MRYIVGWEDVVELGIAGRIRECGGKGMHVSTGPQVSYVF